MTMSKLHATVIDRVKLRASVRDRRIKNVGTAIRYLGTSEIKDIVQDVLSSRGRFMERSGINADTGRRIWRRSQLAALRIACAAVHKKFGYTGAELLHRVWSCYAICGGQIPGYAGCPMERVSHMERAQIEVAREVNRVLQTTTYRPDGLNV